jgi:hypothetical protein
LMRKRPEGLIRKAEEKEILREEITRETKA